MLPKYDYGDRVRVIRNVRDDGTFPGKVMGDFLVRRGSIGYVQNVGSFLQDEIIYSVHFLDENIVVGCREEELISGDDPWVPSKYEFRDKVITLIPLSAKGEIIAEKGSEGQVLKIIRDMPGGVMYHVHFGDGRLFMIPETALDFAPVVERKLKYTNDESTSEE
ncbi:nitrogen fixation protein NifZ [Beggiatoa leptomitoformis]|uniref:Nitrogen fixation protein NifZ n=1 Tax=Beggiatoa leptomitoformis TaxID=288004 RepID=A0A2N9YFQ4_9GAMM|nr:nitrogen fixation protein NifZ [Beggiatoa leptomitoformis]ALG68357.1 nitrogen fixation protein NifZ [Beggiatoa leptomitoformis]AUI69324.1 nitrogen fixation protein NifZ [Beggiatoa leptomitoformis]